MAALQRIEFQRTRHSSESYSVRKRSTYFQLFYSFSMINFSTNNGIAREAHWMRASGWLKECVQPSDSVIDT